jgi:hypothetical protein
MTGSSKKAAEIAAEGMVFALDIGTRSIVGIVGTVEAKSFGSSPWKRRNTPSVP